MRSWRRAAARACGLSYTGTSNIWASWRATAATRAPQSMTWGSPGVRCSASMSSQARSMLRLLKGSAATFARGVVLAAELLSEDGLVLLHEVGRGLDERL